MRFFQGWDTVKVVSALIVLMALSACEIPGSESDSFEPVAGACQISGDQQGAFMARVPAFPIPVRIDAAFGSDELPRVRAAIDTWNAFGRQLIHEDFLQVVSD